jgi:hypothetical protein
METTPKIEFHPETKEPFIRLQEHKNLILTLQRKGDEDALISILNDDKVWYWLEATPHPYTRGATRVKIEPH